MKGMAYSRKMVIIVKFYFAEAIAHCLSFNQQPMGLVAKSSSRVKERGVRVVIGWPDLAIHAGVRHERVAASDVGLYSVHTLHIVTYMTNKLHHTNREQENHRLIAHMDDTRENLNPT